MQQSTPKLKFKTVFCSQICNPGRALQGQLISTPSMLAGTAHSPRVRIIWRLTQLRQREDRTWGCWDSIQRHLSLYLHVISPYGPFSMAAAGQPNFSHISSFAPKGRSSRKRVTQKLHHLLWSQTITSATFSQARRLQSALLKTDLCTLEAK